MNFGEAIKCMKKGKKVTRNVWKENFFNGRKQFIFIGKNKGLTTNTFLAILPEEECFSDCIMGYTRKGIFQPNWTPTQEDMLAEDWEMYPAEETVVDETPNITADEMIDLKNRIGWNIKFYSTGETIISEHMDYQKLLTGAESTYMLSFVVPKKSLDGLSMTNKCQNVIVSGLLFKVYASRNIADDSLWLVTESALSEKEFHTIIRLER